MDQNYEYPSLCSREKGPYLQTTAIHRFDNVDTAAVFAERAKAHFERVHRDVFDGDPAANPNLQVEVVGAGLAADTPVLVLVAPWTLCGLAAPPDGRLPSALRVGHRQYPVLVNEVDGLGEYHSVILVPDVSRYPDQDQILKEAATLAAEFRLAVERAREEMTEVPDADRRAFFRTAKGGAETDEPARTAFGNPKEIPSELDD